MATHFWCPVLTLAALHFAGPSCRAQKPVDLPLRQEVICEALAPSEAARPAELPALNNDAGFQILCRYPEAGPLFSVRSWAEDCFQWLALKEWGCGCVYDSRYQQQEFKSDRREPELQRTWRCAWLPDQPARLLPLSSIIPWGSQRKTLHSGYER